MPTLTGTIAEITGSPIDPDSLHEVTVRAPSRRASLADPSRIVAAVSVPVEVSAGGVISVDLEPGPAVLRIEGEGLHDTFELGVTEDMTLLTEAIAESAPTRTWVESKMVQLRAQAVDAAGAAAEASGHAVEAAEAAEQHRAHVDSIRETLDEAAQSNVAPYLTKTELNATYAFTEPRQVNVFHHGVSPANSAAANRAAFQAAIDAAPEGATVVMPSTSPDERIHINDKLVPRPGMTVAGLGGRGYIAQDVWGKPVFDLPYGEVEIERWDALSTPSKSALTGAYRDGSATNAAAVVWLGGHQGRVSDVIGRGFTSVCRATPWDEVAQALGSTADGHVFERIGVDGCDWGVVGSGFREATFRDFYGTYNTRAGSGDPGHLIYIAPQRRSFDVTITDCTTVNGSGGRAFSLKNINGLNASGLSSRACEGFLDYNELANARLANLRALDDLATTDGVVYGFGGSVNENIVVSGAIFEPHPGSQAVRIDGLNGIWSDLSILASRESFSDLYDINVQGEGNTLIRPSVINRTAFAWRFLGLHGSGHHVMSPQAKGTRAGITVTSAVPGCVLEYSPALVNVNRAGTFSATVSNANATTVFNIAPTVIRQTTDGGTTIRGNSSEYSVMQVIVTGSGAVTIQSPYDRPNGHEVTYEITNTTTSAMGVISFTGSHVTSGTFPSPGAGKTSAISFRYDGVDNVWRETRRSVAV